MQFLKVKNFGKYQHYTDRNPPWIKLYRSLLNDYDFHQLTIPSRLLYVCCLILASESDNRIPHDYQFLSGRCAMEVNEQVLTPLIDSGFLLASGARRTLASCKHFATSSSLLSSSEERPLLSDLSAPSSPNLKSLKTPDLKSKSHAPKSAPTWAAYCAAYHGRYGVEPVRNTQVNAMLCKLVDKLGATEAPEVSAFYLHHNAPFYVVKRHPVNLLLADAEGLRTQWATGTKSTASEAKNAEAADSAREQVKRVEAMLKETPR